MLIQWIFVRIKIRIDSGDSTDMIIPNRLSPIKYQNNISSLIWKRRLFS